eukprot:4044814-Ditylum_brightwellii.AAC.1
MVNSNIKLFNQYIKENHQGLKARVESTDDLMTNIFKAYLVALDKDFVNYFEAKKDNNDNGQDLMVKTLMQ